jgi:hypothetical protein
MPAIMITNPLWCPAKPTLDLLNLAVLQEIRDGKASAFKGHERKKLSGDLAMDATMALLAPARKAMSVVDVNDARRNMPGYDILVADHLRIQVKGGTYVDSVGWAHTAHNPAAADLAFDIEIVVDVGVVLDPRPLGRRNDGRDQVPLKPHVDFYIIPGEVVRSQVGRADHINGRGAHLYLYKRTKKAGDQEYRGQWFELPTWRNRFDVLEAALGKL